MIRLKELRLERQLTQKQLAQKLGITQQTVGYYEQGINQPSHDMLIQMADFFECSTDYLLGRSDDFGNIVVYEQTDNIHSLSHEEQKIIDVLRKSAPIYPVDFITLYAELPTYMQEALFAELKGMNLGYKVSKKKAN